MSIFADIYVHKNRPYHYNAFFEYGENRFDVNVTNLQYSWGLTMSGASQARARQTNYPKRVEQGSLVTNLRFRDIDEYLRFCEWVRGYHMAITKVANPPRMRFASNGNTHGATWDYLVAIPNVSMSITHNMEPAPEMKNLKLDLLRDALDLGEAGSSDVIGTPDDLVGDKVISGDIKNLGSSRAYRPAK